MSRGVAAAVGIVLVLVMLNWAAAVWILWTATDRLGEWFQPETRPVHLTVEYAGYRVELHSGAETHLVAAKSKAHFVSDPCDFTETRQAWTELTDTVSVWKRLGAAVGLRPRLTALSTVGGERCWTVEFVGGTARVAMRSGLLREIRYSNAHVCIDRGDRPRHGTDNPVRVRAVDLDKSLAAALRILRLQLVEVVPEPDGVRQEGNGTLIVQNGHRLLRLRGSPYEIGFQHGRLLSANIRRLGERIVYGVGLYYSLEKGQWFLDEAAKLVERQRPFIDPAYFEEMRGLADGAGMPLALVQAANIFPEFFHCSGLAVFGNATRDGRLFHARVLDYMTHVGLQDEAVTMAVERTGVRRFVNISYAGFIGCVTGMNEKQVAIGEMGGRGEGQWDGTPMAQLIRGALEHCDTLEEALDYMRQRPRTCEYYYVISDGKSRTARGVAAVVGGTSRGRGAAERREPVHRTGPTRASALRTNRP